MKFRTLLLGTAAAMAVSGAAQAADLAIAVEPIDYVKICDAFGVGYWYIPGTDTCLKIGGYVQLDVWFYDDDRVGNYANIANQLTGAVTPTAEPASRATRAANASMCFLTNLSLRPPTSSPKVAVARRAVRSLAAHDTSHAGSRARPCVHTPTSRS